MSNTWSRTLRHQLLSERSRQRNQWWQDNLICELTEVCTKLKESAALGWEGQAEYSLSLSYITRRDFSKWKRNLRRGICTQESYNYLAFQSIVSLGVNKQQVFNLEIHKHWMEGFLSIGVRSLEQKREEWFLSNETLQNQVSYRQFHAFGRLFFTLFSKF